MNNLDEKILKAPRADVEEILKDLNEPGVLTQVLTTMRAVPCWAVVFIFVWNLAFTIAAVWCAVKFFRAEEVQHMIAWATGVIVSMSMVLSLKIWFWMQMDKYVVLREVKRLELQVARLVERLSE